MTSYYACILHLVYLDNVLGYTLDLCMKCDSFLHSCNNPGNNVMGRGDVDCHWKRHILIQRKGICWLSEERRLLYVRGKGFVDCQKKGLCWLSEEMGLLAVRGKGFVVCWRKGVCWLSEERGLLYVRGKGVVVCQMKGFVGC